MAEREQKPKTAPGGATGEVVSAHQGDHPVVDHAREVSTAAAGELEAIDEVLADEADQVAAMDQLLDDVEAVLETDADTFVRGYVQKGGQ